MAFWHSRLSSLAANGGSGLARGGKSPPLDSFKVSVSPDTMRRAGGPRRLGDGAWTNERLTEFEGSDDDAGADSLSDSSDDDGASWPSPASTKRNSNRLSGLSDVTLLATPISSPRRLNGKVLSPTPEDSPTAKEDLPNVPPPPSSPFDDEPSTPGSGRAGPRLQRHPSFEEARSKFLGGEPRAGPPTATPPDTPAFQWSPRDRLNQSRMRHHTLLFSGRVNGVDWPEVVKRNSTWEPKAGYVEVPYPEREVEEPRGVFRALRDETVSVTPPDMGEDDGVGPKFDRSEEHTDQKPRGYPESKPEGVYIEESDSRECTKEDGAIEDRTSSQLTALNELLYNAGFSTLPGHTTDNISNVTDVVPLSHAIVVIQQLHQTLRIASDRLTGNEVALNRSNSDNKVLRDRVGRLKRELDVMGRSAAEAKARADKESARAKEMEGKMASMETQMRTLKRESEKMAKLLQQYQNNANAGRRTSITIPPCPKCGSSTNEDDMDKSSRRISTSSLRRSIGSAPTSPLSPRRSLSNTSRSIPASQVPPQPPASTNPPRVARTFSTPTLSMKRSPKAPRAPFPDRVQPDEVRSGGADNDLKLCRDSVEEVKPRHVDDDQPPHYAHPPPAAPAIDDRPPSQTNITSITASATSMALHQHHHHTYLTPSPEPLHHALAHHQLGLPVSTLSPPPHLVTPPECQQQHHSPLLETLLEHQTRLLNLLVLQPQHPLTGAAGVHPFSLEMSPTPTPPPSQGPQQQGLVVPGLEEERGRLRGVAVELARERERLEEERAAFGKEVWGFRTKVVMGGVDEALRMVEDANRVEEA